MFEIFIRRPILSGVISVVIVFLGLLGIKIESAKRIAIEG